MFLKQIKGVVLEYWCSLPAPHICTCVLSKYLVSAIYARVLSLWNLSRLCSLL